ncbi:uncharacterized protein M6B38_366380 [Iris pallida]|uniref:Carbohydrate kinase PfkB domain-containing protein n=1 Tax=Iris pallida TaxID=29817 RepID=A0AAX6GGN3_IRIPA|nr:uncharacterized protein M6B38_366380 [Iris pallida]
MESSAFRRLQTIAHHVLLLVPETSTNNLNPNHSSSVELECADSSSYPVIIGGMVLDVNGRPFTDTLPGTTTPGKIQHVSGGVARNVAECMSKLGSKPFIISVVGLDIAGDVLLKYWESSGLPTSGILKLQGVTTPIVSNIFDSRGELAAAVASVEAVEKFLTPDWIWQLRDTISSAPLLMVDANLNPKSLEAACKVATESGIPVWFEPVSVTKSVRIASIANYITCTSPNEDELLAMAHALSSGEEFCVDKKESAKRKRQSIESFFSLLKPAICVLLEKGIKLLVVTLGSDGVFICSREIPSFMKDSLKNTRTSIYEKQLYELVNESCPPKQYANSPCALHFPALPSSVVSLTGAGDCLVGGILSSLSTGLDMMQSVAMGVAVAKAAVECETNIPAEFSLTKLAAEARQILLSAKQLVLD